MKASLLSLLSLPFIALAAHVEGGYTNHAGNVVAGWPVKLTATQVTLAERATPTARWGHRALPGRGMDCMAKSVEEGAVEERGKGVL